MHDTDEQPGGETGTHLGADAFESLVRRIVAQNRHELQRRAALNSRVRRNHGWPVLALPASLAVALMAGLILIDPPSAEPLPTVAEAVLPTPVAAWLQHDYPMEPLEVAAALEGMREASR